MGIQVNAKNRSDAYIGTFDYECADDMLSLANLRDMVSNMNRMLREDGRGEYQFRVVLKGRGDNRFERSKQVFKDKYGSKVSDGYIKRRVAQDLPLSVADRVDAYIYRR